MQPGGLERGRPHSRPKVGKEKEPSILTTRYRIAASIGSIQMVIGVGLEPSLLNKEAKTLLVRTSVCLTRYLGGRLWRLRRLQQG